MLTLSGKTKDKLNFNYSLHLNMNDLVFDQTYIVNNSDFNFNFPLGKNPDFQWKLKGYFKYIEPGKALQLKHYQFQKFSIIKDEKSRSEASRLNKILQPVHHSMFIESNPSPVKYAAKLLNLCEDDVRLPLVKVTDPTKEIIKKVLQSAKLI